MNDNPWRAQRPSGDAMHLMALLLSRGGGMRIAPLLRISRLLPDALVTAINELNERWWIDIVWRSDQASRPEHLPRRIRDARRIATTRIGRHCYPFIPKF